MPPNGEEEGTEGAGDSGESEDAPDELTALKDEVSTLKSMLTALITPPEEEEEEDTDENDEPDEDKDKKKPKTKSKPHAHTIKYAESLKKQMGKVYVSDWDKIPITKRIQKMETIMEFNANLKKDGDGKKKGGVKEGKGPKGKPDTPKKPTLKFGGINYKALAAKLNKL